MIDGKQFWMSLPLPNLVKVSFCDSTLQILEVAYPDHNQYVCSDMSHCMYIASERDLS